MYLLLLRAACSMFKHTLRFPASGGQARDDSPSGTENLGAEGLDCTTAAAAAYVAQEETAATVLHRNACVYVYSVLHGFYHVLHSGIRGILYLISSNT